MIKCIRCGGSDAVTGRITRSSKEYFSDVVFGPEGIRFLTVTVRPGTKLDPEGHACLDCGTVWSHTDPAALREFIQKHCRTPRSENLEL